MRRLRRFATLSGLVALAVVAITGTLAHVGVFATLDARLTDRLFLPRTARPDIIIIAIDDPSLQQIGRWPWPRDVHAKLLEALAPAKPSVVVFDVAFFEPSTAVQDAALAKAMASVPTVLTVEAERVTLRNGELVAKNLLRPIPVFADASAALGHVHTPADADGIVRAFPPPLTTPQERFPTLAAAALGAAGRNVAFESERIDFAGPAQAIQAVSYAEVLLGRVSAEAFRGAIVFVGATAPNLHDTVLTPISRGSAMPGVELHAQIADQILQGFSRSAIPRWATALLILALGLAIMFTFPRNARLWHAGLIAFVFGLTYNGLTLLAFSRGLVMNMLWPNVAIAGVVVGVVATEYLTASRERRFIRETFSRYVSADVVAHLLEHPERLRLGGEARTLTILFSDIRGFTSLSERLRPAELTRVLNRYLTRMSAAIMAEGGVLDKYIGDAVMAFWGAPIEQRDHASRAVKAALAMQQALREFNAELDREGLPQIAIGIGINTGEVIVGNMGSDQRFDYTVIGDAVNLASRLEGLNKVYGTTALVSGETAAAWADSGVTYREVDRVAVKGKAQAVPIFEVTQPAEAARYAEAFRAFSEGLKHYRVQQWDGAESCFRRALAQKPADGPSLVLLDRIAALRASPPPADWDGSWQAETK
ncbi:adenylate/guanylate cyclase domain-containing protein [Candidatus Parcubacteria bacterium]|nr:adenylate/guanylate cyclase domain-containing protein [Candidatus Parcubacteria bacterium]